MNQNNEPIRDASVLGIPKMLLLGLQHMFAMFGATILVPMLVNSYFKSGNQVLSIQVTLFLQICQIQRNCNMHAAVSLLPVFSI